MGIRQEKINSLLKRELATLFQRESHTLFNGQFITVTIVRVTPDLSHAKVYLSLMTSQKPQEDVDKIQQQAWAVRKKLAATVGKQMRKIPDLHFYVDDSLDYYEDIDRILKD